MAARAIWKGELAVNSTKVPVKLYAALKDQTVRFHILDDKSKTRVRQHMVDPDSDQADYFALAEGLHKENKERVAHWVMRKQPYVGALRAVDDYLMLFTLRSPDEVVSAKKLPRPAGRAPDKKELSMAKQLVEMLKGEFNAKDYQDEYRQRVMEFVEKKAKGRAPRLRLVKSKRRPASLDKVLSKSIERLKKQKRAA